MPASLAEPPPMITLVGLSGSLRKASLNTALLRAAAREMPPGVRFVEATLRDVPLYDGDLEAAEGLPAAVLRLKEQLAGADALLLATPEYNNAMPGVLKNAIDWMSRPAADIPRVFGAKPVALMGASPGNFGTILSQASWLGVLRTLEMRLWSGGRMMLSAAHRAFDAEGNLVNAPDRERLRRFVHGFVDSLGPAGD